MLKKQGSLGGKSRYPEMAPSSGVCGDARTRIDNIRCVIPQSGRHFEKTLYSTYRESRTYRRSLSYAAPFIGLRGPLERIKRHMAGS